MKNERIIILIWIVVLCLILAFFLPSKSSEKTGEINNSTVGKIISSSVEKGTSPATGNGISPTIKSSTNPVTVNTVSSGTKISYANLEKELSENEIIQSIPSGTILLLRFYNFNTGERTWEKAYILKKGEAKETTNASEKADIVLSLHSKYLQELTSENFCEVIQKANANKDLGFDTELSKITLAWKFKAVFKYKDCLGI